MNDQYNEGQEVSAMKAVESKFVVLLNKSEIDMQVATAHKYRDQSRIRMNPADGNAQ